MELFYIVFLINDQKGFSMPNKSVWKSWGAKGFFSGAFSKLEKTFIMCETELKGFYFFMCPTKWKHFFFHALKGVKKYFSHFSKWSPLSGMRGEKRKLSGSHEVLSRYYFLALIVKCNNYYMNTFRLRNISANTNVCCAVTTCAVLLSVPVINIDGRKNESSHIIITLHILTLGPKS